MSLSAQTTEPQDICKFFQRGSCTFGDSCKNQHKSAIRPPCVFFSLGKCMKGDGCNFSHSASSNSNLPSPSALSDVAARSGTRHANGATSSKPPCIFWPRACKKGDACPFFHAQAKQESDTAVSPTPSTPSSSNPKSPILEPVAAPSDTLDSIEHSPTNSPGYGGNEHASSSDPEAPPDEGITIEPPILCLGAATEDLQPADYDTIEPADASFAPSSRPDTPEDDILDDDVSGVYEQPEQPGASGTTPGDTHEDEVGWHDAVDEDSGATGAGPCDIREDDDGWYGEANEQPETAGTTVDAVANVPGIDKVSPNQDSQNPPGPQLPEVIPHWSEYADPFADLNIPFCKFFAQARCHLGDVCSFRHSLSISEYSLLFRDPQPSLWSPRARRLQTDFAKPSTASAFGVCKFYPLGKCRNADVCPYLHIPTTALPEQKQDQDQAQDQEPSQPGWYQGDPSSQQRQEGRRPCTWYFQNGYCRRGDQCSFSHDETQSPSSNGDTYANTRHENGGQWESSRGEDFRQPIRPCKWFLQGNCHRGDRCSFLHEDIEQAGATGATGAIEATENGEHDSAEGWGEDSPGWGTWDETPAPDWGEPPSKPVPEPTPDAAEGEWPPTDDEDPWAEPGPTPCPFYAQGSCRKGAHCNLSHALTGNDIGEGRAEETSVAADEWPEDTPAAQNDDIREHTADDDNNATTSDIDGDAETWAVDWSNPPVEPLPPVRVRAPCKAYGQGLCELGDACPFLHIDQQALELADDEPPSPDPLVDVPVVKVERSLFHCNVEFGNDNGCSPTNITTASESRCVVLFNLPTNILHEELYDLAKNIGDVNDIDIEPDERGTSARGILHFADYAQAVIAATQLDGQTYDSRLITARLDSPAAERIMVPLVCHSVKLIWPVPSIYAWAFYPTITIAKAQEKRLVGLVYQGRKIQASFYRPRPKQKDSFAVKITGLPLETDTASLKEFCVESSLVTLEIAVDIPSSVENIRRRVESIAGLDSFDLIPKEEGQTEHTAFARFSTGLSEVIALDGTALGNGSLSVQQVFHASYGISNKRYQAIRGELDQVRQMHKSGCSLQIYHHTAHVKIHVSSTLEQVTGFGHVHKRLQSVLQGEILEDEGRKIWDEYFDLSSSAKAMEKMNEDPTFFIKADNRTQTIRVVGDAPSRQRARTAIKRLLKMVHSQRHVLTLDISSLRMLLDGGFKTLQEDVGANKATLDVTVPHLVVRGDTEVLRKVQVALDAVESHHDDQHSRGIDSVSLCVICRRKRNTPRVRLSCTHAYCQTCLVNVLRASAGPCFTPPRCIARSAGDEGNDDTGLQCPIYIPYITVRDLLPTVDEAALLRSSFLAYVRSQPSGFFFCPTPSCETVYRPGREGAVYRCPVCFVQACSSCHFEYHEGLSCIPFSDSDSL